MNRINANAILDVNVISDMIMSIDRVVTITTATVAVLGLAWKIWTDVNHVETVPVAPGITASNSGNGAIVIQGNGNTVNSSSIVPFAQDETRHRLIGKWKGVTTLSTPSGGMVTTGYSYFGEAGEYGFSGELVFLPPENRQSPELHMKAMASGTWRSSGSKYVITASDVKSHATLLREPGKPDIDLGNPSTFPTQMLPKLEDINPKGASQEYTIVELSSTRLRAKGKDIRGTPVYYEATRLPD